METIVKPNGGSLIDGGNNSKLDTIDKNSVAPISIQSEGLDPGSFTNVIDDWKNQINPSRGGFISNSDIHTPNVPDNGDRTADDKVIIGPGSDESTDRKNLRDPSIWTPDTNLSPEDNLNSLSAFLSSLFSSNFSTGGISSTGNYASVLYNAYRSIQNLLNHSGLDGFDREALLALAEKASDISYSFIAKQFESALAYQSWYLQQEYNTPLNQINRLAEAGLSSAFALGNFNSGNAGSAAQVGSPISLPGASGAGQIQQAKSAAEQQNLLGLLNMGISAASAFGEGFSSAAAAVDALVKAKATKSLTPIQIAQGRQDLVNSAATYELLQNQNDQIKQNMALDVLNSSFNNSNQVVSQAKQHVDTAKMRYDTAFQNYSQEYEEQEYEVNVTTKDGRHETRRLDREGVKNLIRNSGKFSDGSTVVGVSSWDKVREAEMHGGADLNIPGGGGVSVGGSGKATNRYGGSKSNTSSTSTSQENTDERSTDRILEGYASDGNSFSIGDTKFTSVITRKRLPLPEHAAHIAKLYKDWQDSFDRFHTLSQGEQARLLQLLNNLTRNLSKLSQGTVHSIFDSKIKSLLNNTPDSLIGD